MSPNPDHKTSPLGKLFGGLTRPPTEAVKQWEKWLAGQFDALARNDRFLDQMGKAMEGSMLFRGQLNRMFEQYLHSARMPSLGDIEGVHKRLDEMERQLDRLTATLEGFEAQNAALAGQLAAFSAQSEALADRLEKALSPEEQA